MILSRVVQYHGGGWSLCVRFNPHITIERSTQVESFQTDAVTLVHSNERRYDDESYNDQFRLRIHDRLNCGASLHSTLPCNERLADG